MRIVFSQNCPHFEKLHKFFYRSLLVFSYWFSAFSFHLAFQDLFLFLISFFTPTVIHQPPYLAQSNGSKAFQNHSTWKPCQKKRNKPIYLKRKFFQKAFSTWIIKYFLQSNLMENEMTKLQLPGMALQWQHTGLAAGIGMFREFVDQRKQKLGSWARMKETQIYPTPQCPPETSFLWALLIKQHHHTRCNKERKQGWTGNSWLCNCIAQELFVGWIFLTKQNTVSCQLCKWHDPEINAFISVQ